MATSTEEPVPVFASLNSMACSEAANALVEHVYAEATRWERETRRRKKGRSEQENLEFRNALERFIGDLLRAHAFGHSGIHRALSAARFTGDVVSYRTFKAAMDALVGIGFVSHTPGSPRYLKVAAFGIRENRSGKASIFAATPKLLKTAEAAGVVGDINWHFKLEMPREPLALRARSTGRGRFKEQGRPLPISPDDTRAQELGLQVQQLNEFLHGFVIEGGHHFGYQRIFNCGDDADFEWNKGGRLYSIGEGSYQSLPSTKTDDRPSRDAMTINGEPVVEIDIRACNLTIFHALVGEPLDLSEDPYGRLEVDRGLAKLWTNATIGNGKLLTQWPADLSDEYEKENGRRPTDICTAGHVCERVLENFPALKKLEDPNAPQWPDLMYLESEAMVTAMTMLRYQVIPSLSVHDSILVPAQHVRQAANCLADSFLHFVGVAPHLTTKSSLPGVQEEVRKAVYKDQRNSERVFWKEVDWI